MSSPASMITAPKKYGRTEVQAHHCTYDWIIQDFKLLPQEYEECIDSPIFRVKDNDEETWQLRLYPHGRDKGEKDVLALYLDLMSPDAPKTEIKVHCELSIVASGVECEKSFVYTYEGVSGYGFHTMIERSKLLNSCGADDSITVRCKINIPQKAITKPLNPVSFNLNKGKLLDHFSHLFKDPRFSDVTIIVGDEKFTAHKLVLAVRSNVFAAMFEHKEMEENRKNEVKIEDLEPATVKGMLEFLYTDKVTDLKTLARELLKASDKYELERLRTMCGKVLYETLTNDNAAEILILSDLYNSHKLKEYVMAFMADHLVSVIQSESYKRMVETHPALVNELLHLIANRPQSKA